MTMLPTTTLQPKHNFIPTSPILSNPGTQPRELSSDWGCGNCLFRSGTPSYRAPLRSPPSPAGPAQVTSLCLPSQHPSPTFVPASCLFLPPVLSVCSSVWAAGGAAGLTGRLAQEAALSHISQTIHARLPRSPAVLPIVSTLALGADGPCLCLTPPLSQSVPMPGICPYSLV